MRFFLSPTFHSHTLGGCWRVCPFGGNASLVIVFLLEQVSEALGCFRGRGFVYHYRPHLQNLYDFCDQESYVQ